MQRAVRAIVRAPGTGIAAGGSRALALSWRRSRKGARRIRSCSSELRDSAAWLTSEEAPWLCVPALLAGLPLSTTARAGAPARPPGPGALNGSARVLSPNPGRSGLPTRRYRRPPDEPSVCDQTHSDNSGAWVIIRTSAAPDNSDTRVTIRTSAVPLTPPRRWCLWVVAHGPRERPITRGRLWTLGMPTPDRLRTPQRALQPQHATSGGREPTSLS